jgi:hypothetical protein
METRGQNSHSEFDFTKTTSTQDLYSLLHKLKVKNVIICRKGEVKKYLKNKMIKNYVINLDDIGNGSHWVSYSRTHNMYFDSYMQSPPTSIPKNAKMSSQKKQLQSLEATDCGGLCCLWLYYINNKSNAEYLKLFTDVYPGV